VLFDFEEKKRGVPPPGKTYRGVEMVKGPAAERANPTTSLEM